MNMKRIAVFAVAVAFAVLVLHVGISAAADAHSGTWKMDPAKSKFSPGPAQKNLTVKIEANEQEIKLHAEGVNGDGSPLNVEYEAKFDGKDYPAKGLPSGADTISVKRLNANTIVSVQKKGGKALMTVTSVLSNNGKTRTSTFQGKDAEGHTVHNVVVYEKEHGEHER
jgi:hypothetical protein